VNSLTKDQCGPKLVGGCVLEYYCYSNEDRTSVGGIVRMEWKVLVGDTILIIKPTRCTNFSNLFLE